MSVLAIRKLTERFGEGVLSSHSEFGDDTIVVKAEIWGQVAQYLRDEPTLEFDLPVDLTGVDFPDRVPRMEVVMHLYSTTRRHRIRVKARVGDDEMNGAEVDSVSGIWPGFNWFEREAFDMCGIKFRGHPDLRRILMYPEFEGHPLLKDYPAQKTQPLIPYRTEEEAGLSLGKLDPFGADEGMTFPRTIWTQSNGQAKSSADSARAQTKSSADSARAQTKSSADGARAQTKSSADGARAQTKSEGEN